MKKYSINDEATNSMEKQQKENIIEELNFAYNALDNIMRYEPTEFNAVGWDGDTSNQFGRDCVIEAIYKEIDGLEEMAMEYGIEL